MSENINPPGRLMLRFTARHWAGTGLICLIFLMVQCASPPKIADAPSAKEERKNTPASAPRAAAREYAGEVLAYTMQVVLGKAGNPKLRDVWYQRGVETELDLNLVSKIMTDPRQDIKRVLVLDNNILGLSEVLY